MFPVTANEVFTLSHDTTIAIFEFNYFILLRKAEYITDALYDMDKEKQIVAECN